MITALAKSCVAGSWGWNSEGERGNFHSQL